ncbi:TPA: radical SAM protein [Candidatus Woesearchaeota archaeon]|nr:hypothetical protein [uncultured archaeon]MBS3172811.1 radical SAM protein [Candidatus Woesearchaeota archaeon]HIH32437.1 radical SAM protein [Candidatus Woesearchaeota archaeon]HIH55378.1 radical SAM protein [Candidatus Woesearchaeota archaeon]HIJ02227.1 radical SAM protein [Candidatus Woesearchaeota archaeon]
MVDHADQNKNIVFLNPPGKNLYLRDYYCSKISKSNYLNQPVDFMILSGIVSERYNIRIIDAMVENLDDMECIKRIKEFNPFAIVFLAGAVSYTEDFIFLKKLKKQTDALLIGSGDIFIEIGQRILKQHPYVDACILDFTTRDILDYLSDHDANNMIYRKNNNIIIGKRTIQKFEIPTPRHELFNNKRYTFPFMMHEPFATALISYGCPFRCDFCIMGTLGYKLRPLDTVIKELKYIKSLGIQEVYFSDQTFGINKKETEKLLKKMIPLKISWSFFWRVDLANDHSVKLMKKAGCHTIMFGVESGNQKILDDNHKGITKEQIKTAFELCRKYKIRTVGTFILGLPGDTEETINETIDFAIQIRSDFASFNTPVPRMGTRLRQTALAKGLVKDKDYDMDQSGNFVIMGNENLSAKEIKILRDKAIKRFYLRPSYIFHRLIGMNSFADLKCHIRNAIGLLK